MPRIGILNKLATWAAADPQTVDSIKVRYDARAFEHSAPFTFVVETEGFNQSIFKSQVQPFAQGALQSEPPRKTQKADPWWIGFSFFILTSTF